MNNNQTKNEIKRNDVDAEDLEGSTIKTYINTVDIFVDTTLDSLNSTIKKEIKVDKIEQTVKDFKSKIDTSPIEILIENTDTKKHIYEIIDKYYYVYLLLSLSFNLSLNDIRDILIKQSNIGQYKFDTENVSLILRLSNLIIDINIIVDNIDDYAKIPNIKQKKNALNFLSLVGIDDVKKLFTKKNINYKHNILKYVIFLEIYVNSDKTTIFKIIENEELSKTEFTYIEIIESLIEEIDYTTIEKLFKGDKGMADNIYDMLLDTDNANVSKYLSIDEKINILFNNNILIPITDEFLRYHKDSETYDKNTTTVKLSSKDAIKSKKENTKIKYIVSKINKLINYHTILQKNDKVAIEEVNKIIYPSLEYRKVVIINELEELNIINKINNQGKKVIENNDYYSDLLSFRVYPYINYLDTNFNGFGFKFNNTKLAIRYCNFEFKDQDKYPNQYKNNIQVRVAPENHLVNIVGVAINPFKLYTIVRRLGASLCTKLNNTLNISNRKNGYINTVNILKNLLNNNISYKTLPYWLFDRNTDKIKIDSYENLAKMNHEEYFKFLLANIYDQLIVITYEQIISKINEIKNIKLFNANSVINDVFNNIININNTDYYNEILNYLYLKKLMIADVPAYDKNENKIPGLNSELIKIPSYKGDKRKEAVILIKKQEYLTGEADGEVDELFESSLCQHQISWNNINIHKKKDPNKFTQLLFEFTKKFVVENKDNDFICKSCSQLVDIKSYIGDSFENASGLSISVSLETSLENIAEYEKYNKAIKNMDKIVEKLAYVSDIKYYLGNTPTNKYHRQDVIKNTIDLITNQFLNFDTANINMRKERMESANKLYGISKELSNYFIFDMDNNLFTYSSKDVDKFKKYKNNNIYAYMVFLYICDINIIQITQLAYDKIINYIIFDKFANHMFDGLLIRINNGNDVKPIIQYKLLCYVIYYLSAMIIK